MFHFYNRRNSFDILDMHRSIGGARWGVKGATAPIIFSMSSHFVL